MYIHSRNERERRPNSVNPLSLNHDQANKLMEQGEEDTFVYIEDNYIKHIHNCNHWLSYFKLNDTL